MKFFIQSAAETDILRQFEWYAEQGLIEVARRFLHAVNAAIDALTATPAAGAPKHFDNPGMAGLRAWPVSGFDEIRIYYLFRPELLTIVRVLHGKRDIEAVLEGQNVEQPGFH